MAGGTPPLSWQWHFEGMDVPGATNSSLTITSVQSANLGNYTATSPFQPAVTTETELDPSQSKNATPLKRLEVLSLSAIRRDPRLQCRVAMNQATIATYAERLKARDSFPPLDVFAIEQDYFLVDDWHRYAALLKLGLTKVRVQVHQGTWQDAIRFALQANSRHGLGLSNRDKRRAVEIALRELPNESDRAIADCCKVSHTLVAKVRSQLTMVASCSKRTGRDGKTRKLPSKPGRRLDCQTTKLTGAAESPKATGPCPPEVMDPDQRWKAFLAVLQREYVLWPAPVRSQLVQRLNQLTQNWEASAGKPGNGEVSCT